MIAKKDFTQQDTFKSYIMQQVNEYNSGKQLNGVNDLYQCAFVLQNYLKYEPDNTSLLCALARIAFQLKYYGEAYFLAEKSYNIDQNDSANQLLHLFRNPSLPSVANFEISTVCGLKCPMCQHGYGGNLHPNLLMPLDTFKAMWDKVRTFTKNIYLLGGGETFMHPKVYEILEYCKDANIVIHTNANTKMDFDKIIDYVNQIHISVDGINQEMYEKYRVNGNFEKVINNVRGLVKAKRQRKADSPEILFKFIAFKHTEQYENEAYALAESLDVDSFRLEPAAFPALHLGRDMYNEFMPTKPEHKRLGYIDFEKKEMCLPRYKDNACCTASFISYFVNIKGDISPCCNLSTHPNIITFGNLSENSFEEIWNHPRYRDFRIKVLKNRWQEPKCRVCFSAQPFNAGKFFEGTNFMKEPYWHDTPSDTRFNILAEPVKNRVESI